MPSLKYLPEIVATLRRGHVPEEAIDRYQARCLALSRPSYILPCPYCYIARGELLDLTTVRSNPAEQKLLCTTCLRELGVTAPLSAKG